VPRRGRVKTVNASAVSGDGRAIYVPVSFEVNFDRSDTPMYLRHLNEWVTPALKHGWPVIAQQQLFDSLTSAPGVVWTGFQTSAARMADEVAAIDKRIIPDAVEAALLAECGGIDEAWVALNHEVVPSLVDTVSGHLSAIRSEYGTIGSVVMWRSNPSVRIAADSLGIPVIDVELTSFRHPLYRDVAAYFQYGPRLSTDEYDRRLQAFLSEDRASLPVLTRKEILSLFLSDECLPQLWEMDRYETHEVGVALISSDAEADAQGTLRNDELLDRVGRMSPPTSVLVRPHPPSRPKIADRFELDTSKCAAEFILRCRRVVTATSNVAYEAMLLGKTAYIWGPLPFAKAAVSDRASLTEDVVDLLTLNFITFGFFAPYDLVFDREYLDWRTSRPSETDIYRRHLDHYLAKWGVDPEALHLTGLPRLAAFIRPRGITSTTHIVGRERRQLAEDLIWMRHELAIMRPQVARLSDVLASTSWRFTAPLRAATKAAGDIASRLRNLKGSKGP
jgi:hypothetical protein